MCNNLGVVDEPQDTPPPKVLTAKQVRLLQFVRDYIKAHGYPPSVRECMPVGPWNSSSGVAHQLAKLESKGQIQRGPGPRMITLVSDGE